MLILRSFLLTVFLAALSAGGTDPGNATSTRQELKVATPVQGYSCAAGHAWFFADGKLAACSVSRETRLGEITVPEKSIIYLDHDGSPRFVFLAHNAPLNGYVCRGGGHDYSTALYPGGALKNCWLASDTVVRGIPCMQAGFFADVLGGGVETSFYEDGKLKSCKLSRAVMVEGQKYSKGDHIRLNSSGGLLR